MLDIDSLIWTIPGVVGLFIYNRRLERVYPQPGGWAYLFVVVIFAAPYFFILEIIEFLLKFGLNYLGLSEYILLGEPLIDILKPFTILLALIFSIATAIYLGNKFAQLKNKDPAISDPFLNCCYLWEKQCVLITLKDSKVYLAVLLGWTKDLSFDPTIRVIPLYSGYRDGYRHIYWTFKYPTDVDHEAKKPNSPGLIISQKDIVTIALWDYSHEYTKAAPISELTVNS